jgi:hypothetical protein
MATAAHAITGWPAQETDECGQVFAAAINASGWTLPDHASVLEIGSAEYAWLKRARECWPSVQLTGIDWRKGTTAEGATVIRGDVLVHDFPPESFDAVVAISTIEHIGLGHYDRDPRDEDGDTRALARAWTWLKSGGLLYFDVPWNAAPYMVSGTRFRCYDDAAHETRLRQSAAWTPVWRGWCTRDRPHVKLLTERPSVVLRPEHKQFYSYACIWRKGN